MKTARLLFATCLALLALPSGAWSNHSFVTYRAFDTMPEVAQAAPVPAEPLEAFLKDQEAAIATLLAGQDVILSF